MRPADSQPCLSSCAILASLHAHDMLFSWVIMVLSWTLCLHWQLCLLGLESGC